MHGVRSYLITDRASTEAAQVSRHLVVRASPSQEHTQRSGRATTKHQVRDRPDRLNDATQNPQRLGAAHLRTRTPG